MLKNPRASRLAFVLSLGAVLSLWPVACAGHGGSPSSAPSAAAGAPGASPSSLASRAMEFLPHPAFARADTGSGSASIADIAEKAAPSVVNVSSSRTVKMDAREQLPFFFEDPMFRRFFGPPGGAPEREQRHREQGLGSGVVVEAPGGLVVLTNNHVVEGADEIKVTTSDKREFPAKVVGTDAKSDVAVLRLQGDTAGLRAIPVGDSSRLRLGDVVLAIGNPFGVGQTITMGIVSAKGRANVGIAAYEDFIQTDAAINPGNSGGALVDMQGNLVGINTAILSRSGGNMGIGFAIPTNMAQPIMKSLLEHGRVVRGWLGVGIQDLDQDLAAELKMKTARGVLVSEIMPGSPGEKAGLKSGDVVLALNGQAMDSTGEFRNTVASLGAGATAKLTVLRDGKEVAVEAKLGELPEKNVKGSRGPGAEPGAPAILEGLTLGELDAATRRRFDVAPEVKSGVVVTEIEPGSPAASSGLRPGDVVLEVNRVPTPDLPRARQAFAGTKDRALLRVAREGRTLFLVVKR